MPKQTKTLQQQRMKLPPARTPEAQENRMMLLAMDLAERQLRDGSASSQVISHFLKLASSKEQLEKSILEKQKELISAKTEEIKSHKRVEELYAEALTAMRRYSGQDRKDADEAADN